MNPVGRWAGEADWQVITRTERDWRLAAPVDVTGGFDAAARRLATGFRRAAPAPVLRFYPNRVLEIMEAGA